MKEIRLLPFLLTFNLSILSGVISQNQRCPKEFKITQNLDNFPHEFTCHISAEEPNFNCTDENVVIFQESSFHRRVFTLDCKSNHPITFNFQGSRPQFNLKVNSQIIKDDFKFGVKIDNVLMARSAGVYSFGWNNTNAIDIHVFFEGKSPHLINEGQYLEIIRAGGDLKFPCRSSKWGQMPLLQIRSPELNSTIGTLGQFDPKFGWTIPARDISQGIKTMVCELPVDGDEKPPQQIHFYLEKDDIASGITSEVMTIKFESFQVKFNAECFGKDLIKIASIGVPKVQETDAYIDDGADFYERYGPEAVLNSEHLLSQAPPNHNVRVVNCTPGSHCLIKDIPQSGIIMCISNNSTRMEKYFKDFDNKLYPLKELPRVKDTTCCGVNCSRSCWISCRESEDLRQSQGTLISLRLITKGFCLEFLDSGQPFEFECRATQFIFKTPLELEFLYVNGTNATDITNSITVTDSDDRVQMGQIIKRSEVRLSTEVKEIRCKGTLWNSEESVFASLKVNVLEPTKPRFTHAKNQEFTFEEYEKTPFIICAAYGVPRPTIDWMRNGEIILDEITRYFRKDKNSSNYLNLPNLNKAGAGDYICIANNSKGEERTTFKVNFKEFELSSGAIAGIIIASIVAVSLSIVLLYYLLRKDLNGLSKAEINEFLYGNPDAKGLGYAHENTDATPYDRTFEIPNNQLEIDLDDVLGAGSFGVVCRGKVRGEVAAVKTVKPHAEKSYIKALLTELKIMIYLGRHENIINIIGAHTENLKRGKVYVFVEFCPMGNLENFLQRNKTNFVNLFLDDNNYENTKLDERKYENNISFNSNDLISWSYQIANGMEYLATKKVIHGDLAARNVLLFDMRIVKITDFGLSRKLYDYNYIKKQQEPLPWRWMAIESLREFSFSTQSDVWSFGVTLWEIFSLGEVPFPGLAWTNDFVDLLCKNMRMVKPKYCNDEIYNIMLECWREMQNARPSFLELRRVFKSFLQPQ